DTPSVETAVIVSVPPDSAAGAQLEPPSVLYSQPVIGAPPVVLSLTATSSFRSARVTWSMAGCPGTVAGVADRLAEASPAPLALTARTLTSYAVPLVSPVMS